MNNVEQIVCLAIVMLVSLFGMWAMDKYGVTDENKHKWYKYYILLINVLLAIYYLSTV